MAAKGVEDTAFYRYYPLASLNEVGGELDAKPLAIDEFHRLMRHRNEIWPHSISGTATHDTKRGEDFRARLHVLSEASQEWIEAFGRWQKMNGSFVREIDGDSAPDVNEQYLIYQTLVGTWPIEAMDATQLEQYHDRIVQYTQKALREAKIHTSWMNPSETYASAVRDFIGDLLGDSGQPFQDDICRFVRQIADSGFVNSLAQVLLKTTLPGVPDFYQGSELWDFNLVDPDNRRPVDFELRRRHLQALICDAEDDPQEFALQLAHRWPAADIKLWVTSRGLNLRHELPDVFTFGEYIPLSATGPAAEHVIGFARRFDTEWVIVVVPRQFYHLQRDQEIRDKCGVPQADWSGTRFVLPDDCTRDLALRISANHRIETTESADAVLDLANVFRVFPVALLTSDSP